MSTDPLAEAAASQLDRDALWRDPPPLAAGCEHDLELLPVTEPRFTVVCRKCGGLDVEASRAICSASLDAEPEYILLPDSSVRPVRPRGPDPLAAFCNARLDEDEAVARAAPAEFDNGEWPFWIEFMSTDRPDVDAACAFRDRFTPARRLREIAALRSVVADCGKALRYPANTPLYNLARRTLAGIASIWDDHPDYESVR